MADKKKPITLNWDEFRALGNPDAEEETPVNEIENEEKVSKLLMKQSIRIWLEKKGRGGKSVSIVTGLRIPKDEVNQIAKDLKKLCGVGGSVKNNEIIIQGEKRDKILDYFKSRGVSDVKKSGG